MPFPRLLRSCSYSCKALFSTPCQRLLRHGGSVEFRLFVCSDTFATYRKVQIIFACLCVHMKAVDLVFFVTHYTSRLCVALFVMMLVWCVHIATFITGFKLPTAAHHFCNLACWTSIPQSALRFPSPLRTCQGGGLSNICGLQMLLGSRSSVQGKALAGKRIAPAWNASATMHVNTNMQIPARIRHVFQNLVVRMRNHLKHVLTQRLAAKHMRRTWVWPDALRANWTEFIEQLHCRTAQGQKWQHSHPPSFRLCCAPAHLFHSRTCWSGRLLLHANSKLC